MNIVLFLGAGFSRAVGLPTMREFFNSVNLREDIANDEKQFLRELRTRARAGASMLEGENDNLEHILSFAMMDFAVANSSPAAKLKSILQRVYVRFDTKHASTVVSRFGRILGARPNLELKHSYTIITTNYDLFAEFALRELGKRCRLGFAHDPLIQDRPQGSDFMYEEDMRWPLLVKLHGSLNWFPGATPGDPLRVEDSYVSVRGPMELESNRAWYLPLMSAANFFTDNPQLPEPLIIPPTLYKQHQQYELERIWGLAHSSLADADRVWFIGYSFPESDTYMKSFLAAALVKNIDLSEIRVVAPDAEEIVTRLRNTHFGTHFKRMLKPISGRWEEDKIDLTS